jgi:FKBP-type peptidyl-prolyl cis-trans isomerase SlyD
MKVAPSTVVSLEYSLHLGDGAIVDSSDGEPLSYLHGIGQILPGLEREIEGMEPGQSKTVVLAPKDGYGERDPNAVQEVDRAAFGEQPIKEGDELVAVDDHQNQMPVKILKLGDKTATVDFNHPLAGKPLHFSVTVHDVRAATEEEMSHGHAHGPEGHHHH